MNTHKHIKRILNNKHLISFGDSDDDNECVTHIGQIPSNNNNNDDEHEHIHELKAIHNNDSDDKDDNSNSFHNSDDDESVSLSENDEIVRNAKASSGVISNEKKQNNVISNNKSNNIHERNTQITLLTNEIHNIKNNINTTSNSLFKDHQNNNSILDHYNKKYLHLKRNRNTTTTTSKPKSLPSKIIAFHNHLLTAKSNPSSKHSWLTSKLKFHVDSEKAYSISKLHN